MTATRWWVRLAARWLARIDGVSGQLRLAMLGLTAVSTGVVALQSYGLGELAAPLVATVAIAGLAFAYLYAEGGVWNQVQRDKRDLSTNYAAPMSRIDDEMIARGVIAAEKGRTLDEEERAAVREELDRAFVELREGVDLERIDNSEQPETIEA
jgi:hypothetical protein